MYLLTENPAMNHSSQEEPPQWIIHITLEALKQTWKYSQIQPKCNQPTVESFKSTVIEKLSNLLEENIEINNITQNTPDKISNMLALPNTNWDVYKLYANMHDLQPLGKTIFINIKTTGLKPSSRIVQISLIMININSKEPFTIEKWQRKINPLIDILPEVSKIHGITNQTIQKCSTLSRYTTSIQHYLKNATIVGFNINLFDIPILNNEFLRINPKFQGFGYKHLIDIAQIYWKFIPRDLPTAY